MNPGVNAVLDLLNKENREADLVPGELRASVLRKIWFLRRFPENGGMIRVRVMKVAVVSSRKQDYAL